VAGAPVKFTRREFDLLELLVRHDGRAVTHGTILERVSGTSDLRRTHTLRVHVTQLRKKLQAPGAPQIVAEAGVGYRLVG
jgi:two-component system KDP operon response regulator KdpE